MTSAFMLCFYHNACVWVIMLWWNIRMKMCSWYKCRVILQVYIQCDLKWQWGFIRDLGLYIRYMYWKMVLRDNAIFCYGNYVHHWIIAIGLGAERLWGLVTLCLLVNRICSNYVFKIAQVIRFIYFDNLFHLFGPGWGLGDIHSIMLFFVDFAVI